MNIYVACHSILMWPHATSLFVVNSRDIIRYKVLFEMFGETYIFRRCGIKKKSYDDEKEIVDDGI